jgi:hypothetical protein
MSAAASSTCRVVACQASYKSLGTRVERPHAAIPNVSTAKATSAAQLRRNARPASAPINAMATMNTSCGQMGIAPKLIRLATSASNGAPTSTPGTAYRDFQPDSAMASSTPTNPTPAPRNSAVAANRAAGSLSPAKRPASRTAQAGAPNGRGSGRTHSITSHSRSATPAMRDAEKCLTRETDADMDTLPETTDKRRLARPRVEIAPSSHEDSRSLQPFRHPGPTAAQSARIQEANP